VHGGTVLALLLFDLRGVKQVGHGLGVRAGTGGGGGRRSICGGGGMLCIIEYILHAISLSYCCIWFSVL
jgi:hypothetical protein